MVSKPLKTYKLSKESSELDSFGITILPFASWTAVPSKSVITAPRRRKRLLNSN